VEQLVADGYNVSVQFDDSIIQDRDAEINQGVMLTSSGLMSKKRFMMDTLGLTDEQAEAELAQIQREGPGTGIDITRLYGGME
jgi:A118 family predicted phage portal protein